MWFIGALKESHVCSEDYLALGCSDSGTLSGFFLRPPKAAPFYRVVGRPLVRFQSLIYWRSFESLFRCS